MVTFSPDFFAVMFYSCEVNTMFFIILLQVCKVIFLEYVAVLIIQVKTPDCIQNSDSQFTYNGNFTCSLKNNVPDFNEANAIHMKKIVQ